MNLAPAQKASEYAHMVVNCLSEAPKPCTSARLRPAASGPTSESAKILRTDPWRLNAVTTLMACTASESTSPERSSSLVDALFCCDPCLNSNTEPATRNGKTAVSTSARRHDARYA